MYGYWQYRAECFLVFVTTKVPSILLFWQLYHMAFTSESKMAARVPAITSFSRKEKSEQTYTPFGNISTKSYMILLFTYHWPEYGH